MIGPDEGQGLPDAFFKVGSASFLDFLLDHAPELLPVNQAAPDGGWLDVPHGTTVLALTFPGGVMMAGDRRATRGNEIAHRRLEKVQPADEHSAVAFAGTVGLAVEMVRLFQVELEHYEKMETVTLSLHAKARRLGAIIQANLSMAMQGLAVVPLFAGYDLDAGVGRIFNYDITGAPNESKDYYAEGSGSPFANGALKKLYRPDMNVDDAAAVAINALYDAADDDSATGGPDQTRQIYPIVSVVTADGYRRLGDDEVSAIAAPILEYRLEHPNGPIAPLR